MRRGEAACHAVTVSLAVIATATSVTAAVSLASHAPLVVVATTSSLLLAMVVLRLWLALRREHSVKIATLMAVLAVALALVVAGWVAWAGWFATAFVLPSGDAATAPSAGLLVLALVATLAAQIAQWNPETASARRRQASAILAIVALVSALAEMFMCVVSGQALDAIPLLSATAFAVFALYLVCAAGADTWPASIFTLPPAAAVRQNGAGAAGFVMLALVVLGFLAGTGYYYIAREAALARDAANADLATIADLKVQSIASWYDNHLKFAQLLLAPAISRDDLDAVVRGVIDDHHRDAMSRWMRAILRANGYASVVVFDRQANVRLAVGTPINVGETIRQRVFATLPADAVQVDDIHRDPDSGNIALDLWVPLRVNGAAAGHADGALLLRLDPAQSLYPMVQTWPTTSASAETLLVRRDGDSVLFLNELRHRSGTALRLHLPLAGSLGVPALVAVSGGALVAEGPDYRGEPVLAAVRAVPHSPWFLIAKTDRTEIYAPVNQRIALLATLIAVVGFAALLGVAILWRQRSYAQVCRELQLQRASVLGEQRYRRLVENISDALMIDDAQGNLVYVNDRFLALYGYARDEVIGRHFTDFSAPQWRDSGRYRHQQRVAGEPVSDTFEYQALRKDGSWFWGEVRVSSVIEEGRLIGTQSTIQDISERKRAQELQAALLHISEAAHEANDMDDLYRRIHQIISALLPAQNFGSS